MTNLEKKSLLCILNEIVGDKKSEKQIKAYVKSLSRYNTRYAFTRFIVDIFSVFYPNLQLFYKKIAEIEKVSINSTVKTGKEMLNLFNSWINGNSNKNLSIKENQKILNKTLVWILNEFNKNDIDYYLAGANCFYVQSNTPIIRYHDDIDFLVNENDINKLKGIFDNSEFIFEDNRQNTKKQINPYGFPGGEHEIVAKHKNSEFHIGIFCFRREINGTVIQREYIKVPNKNNNLELKVFEKQITNKKSLLSYDDSWYLLTDQKTKYKAGTIESIYQIKRAGEIEPNREKDAIDASIIFNSGLIDNKKYKKLLKEMKKCKNAIVDTEEKYFR